jgi:hypothetical protein
MLEQFLLTRFAGRADDYARQLENGRYCRARQPFTINVVRRHLRGDLTAAVYQLHRAEDGTLLSPTGLLDFDTSDGIERAAKVWKTLHGRGIPALVETSRVGRAHLWVFFADPLPSVLVRQALKGALAAAGDNGEGAEAFPKSVWLEPHQMGTTTRLPLGLHRKCDPPTRFGFYDPERGEGAARDWGAQAAVLSAVGNVERGPVEALAKLAPKPPALGRMKRTPRPIPTGGSTITKLNAALLARYGGLSEVVAQFADPPDGRGWTKCPFHEDHHKSFRVDERHERAFCYVCAPQRSNLRFATFDAFEFMAQARFGGNKREAVRVLAGELLPSS